MDEYWEIERLKLYELREEHPEWTQKRIAEQLGHCVSWVKKWLRRFRETRVASLDMFRSQSRARHHEIADTVRHAVLDFRDQLKEVYGRVVGAKTILYHLHKDEVLKKSGLYIPRAASTIHKILREGGRISVGKYDYSLGYKHAGKKVGVWLDAKQFMIASEVVKSAEIQGIVGHAMSWNDYFNMMMQQARTENN